MVNTLRITSIVAVIGAALVLLLVAGPKSLVPKLLAGFALQSDEETQRILNAPSAVDQWEANRGDKNAEDRNAIPLLVQQAQLLKKIIDPPPKPKERSKDTGRGVKAPVRTVAPPVVSAQFAVVGTSYQAADPVASFAYIRMGDQKTYQWVEIGDEIGHLKIKEVKPDSIICWDGQADVEVLVEAGPDTSSRLEAGSAAAPAEVGAAPVQVTPKLATPASQRISGRPAPRPWSRKTPAGGPDAAALKRMTEKDRRARDLINQIRESGPVEERAARAKRLISEFRSPQVGPREAEKLEDLGRELNESNEASPGGPADDIGREPNKPHPITQ